MALLWTTLLLDSANNGLLGVALLCFSVARWGRWPRALTWLGLAAGAASVPVALLEQTMKRRPGYDEYIRRTSSFLPRPPKA